MTATRKAQKATHTRIILVGPRNTYDVRRDATKHELDAKFGKDNWEWSERGGVFGEYVDVPRIAARCNVRMVVNPQQLEEVAQLFRVCDAKMLEVDHDNCTVAGYMPKATLTRLLKWTLEHPTTVLKIVN